LRGTASFFTIANGTATSWFAFAARFPLFAIIRQITVIAIIPLVTFVTFSTLTPSGPFWTFTTCRSLSTFGAFGAFASLRSLAAFSAFAPLRSFAAFAAFRSLGTFAAFRSLTAFRAIPAFTAGAAFLTNRGCSRFFNFISNMFDPTGGRCWFVIVKADRTFVFCLEGVLVVGFWFTLNGWSASGFSAGRTGFVAISVSTTTSSSPASPPVRSLRSLCGLCGFAVTGFIAVGIFGDGWARFFGETLCAGASGRDADHVLMVLLEEDLAEVIFGGVGCVGVGGVVSVRGG
jgi:hypothetical protein